MVPREPLFRWQSAVAFGLGAVFAVAKKPGLAVGALGIGLADAGLRQTWEAYRLRITGEQRLSIFAPEPVTNATEQRDSGNFYTPFNPSAPYVPPPANYVELNPPPSGPSNYVELTSAPAADTPFYTPPTFG